MTGTTPKTLAGINHAFTLFGAMGSVGHLRPSKYYKLATDLEMLSDVDNKIHDEEAGEAFWEAVKRAAQLAEEFDKDYPDPVTSIHLELLKLAQMFWRARAEAAGDVESQEDSVADQFLGRIVEIVELHSELLNDKVFFDFLRNYLQEIKTDYGKGVVAIGDLLKDLYSSGVGEASEIAGDLRTDIEQSQEVDLPERLFKIFQEICRIRSRS